MPERRFSILPCRPTLLCDLFTATLLLLTDAGLRIVGLAFPDECSLCTSTKDPRVRDPSFPQAQTRGPGEETWRQE